MARLSFQAFFLALLYGGSAHAIDPLCSPAKFAALEPASRSLYTISSRADVQFSLKMREELDPSKMAAIKKLLLESPQPAISHAGSEDKFSIIIKKNWGRKKWALTHTELKIITFFRDKKGNLIVVGYKDSLPELERKYFLELGNLSKDKKILDLNLTAGSLEDSHVSVSAPIQWKLEIKHEVNIEDVQDAFENWTQKALINSSSGDAEMGITYEFVAPVGKRYLRVFYSEGAVEKRLVTSYWVPKEDYAAYLEAAKALE